ncbi:MAG: DUF5666 domain-containing protein [Caldilineaceae bacterium]
MPVRSGVLIAILGALLVTLLWHGPVAYAGESSKVGKIETMPSGTLIGSWRVAGTTFVTSDSTDFRQDKGAFAVGVCVEVEYVGSGEPFTATKIASKSADDCGSSGTPTGTVTTSPGVTPSVTVSSTLYQAANEKFTAEWTACPPMD